MDGLLGGIEQFKDTDARPLNMAKFFILQNLQAHLRLSHSLDRNFILSANDPGEQEYQEITAESEFRAKLAQKLAPPVRLPKAADAQAKNKQLAVWNEEAKARGLSFLSEGLLREIIAVMLQGTDEAQVDASAFQEYLSLGEYIEYPTFLQFLLRTQLMQIRDLGAEDAGEYLRDIISEAKALAIFTRIKNLEDAVTPAKLKSIWNILEIHRQEFRAQIQSGFLNNCFELAKYAKPGVGPIETRRTQYLNHLIEVVQKTESNGQAAPEAKSLDWNILAGILSQKFPAELSEGFVAWQQWLAGNSNYPAARQNYFEILGFYLGKKLDAAKKPEEIRAELAALANLAAKDPDNKRIPKVSEYLATRAQARKNADLKNLLELGKRYDFFDSDDSGAGLVAKLNASEVEAYQKNLAKKTRAEEALLLAPSTSDASEADLYAEIVKALPAANPAKLILSDDRAKEFNQIIDQKLKLVEASLDEQIAKTTGIKTLADLDYLMLHSKTIRALMEAAPSVSFEFESHLKETLTESAASGIWEGFFQKYVSYAGGGLMVLQGLKFVSPWIIPRWAAYLEQVSGSLSPYLFGYNISAMGLIATHIGLETKSLFEKRDLRNTLHELAADSINGANPLISASEEQDSNRFYALARAQFALSRGMDGLFMVGLPVAAGLNSFFNARYILRWSDGFLPHIWERGGYYDQLFQDLGFAEKEFSWQQSELTEIFRIQDRNPAMRATTEKTMEARKLLYLEVGRCESKLARLADFFRLDFAALGLESGSWDPAQISQKAIAWEIRYQNGEVSAEAWQKARNSADKLMGAITRFLTEARSQNERYGQLVESVIEGKITSKGGFGGAQGVGSTPAAHLQVLDLRSDLAKSQNQAGPILLAPAESDPGEAIPE